MKVHIVVLLWIAVVLQVGVASSETPSRMYFAKDLFKTIVSARGSENIIFSPVSIESCLTLAYLGAEGQTANELRSGLKLDTDSKTRTAKEYSGFVKSQFEQTSNGPVLQMANRIYVDEHLQIAPEFNELATKYFDSQAEQVPFGDSAATVKKINTWVEEQTNNKIKNLLQPDAVDADTSTVLVNAIYFKGKWATPFSQSSTHKDEFYVSADVKAPVDMMHNEDRYKFAEVPELDATILEIPYENSDLSMYFILPNKKDGLQEMEKKFASMNLHEIPAKMSLQKLDVFLPKFKVEFEIDLKEPLQKLGMTTMFSDAADFSKLVISTVPQKVDSVKHKAFIDVNEAGSEAAAATFLKITTMSMNLDQKVFRADHPFMFAIRNDKGVYFAGHVANI